jgi:phage host-nuclease inhibitor protein Gam
MIDTTEPDVQIATTLPDNQFTIESDRAAEWLLRKLANIEAEKARVQAQAAAIMSQLESDAESLRFLYAVQLEAYCRSKLEAAGGRRKSITFLQGTCAFRTVPPGLRITDFDAALSYAASVLPGLIQTVTTLDRAAYRDMAVQRLNETGELLPGVEATPERESFTIRFPSAE